MTASAPGALSRSPPGPSQHVMPPLCNDVSPLCNDVRARVSPLCDDVACARACGQRSLLGAGQQCARFEAGETAGGGGSVEQQVASRSREQQAAAVLQRHFRGGRPAVARTSIERGWVGRRAQRLGRLEAHVSFLAWFIRGWIRLRRQGVGSRVAALVTLRFGRRERRTRCGGGARLAGESEFQEQRALAQQMLEWYDTYVSLLRRLRRGKKPCVLHGFCGGGGATEGTRRAGGSSHGIDLREMPDYVRRFGPECFTQGDGTSWALVEALRKAHDVVGKCDSPPCKFYSRARVRGEAREPPLIDIVRDMNRALFEFWSIENVMGARKHMAEDATVLTGFYFGLRVNRGRLFETSFKMILDDCVLRGARRLESRSCLGSRSKWRSFDEFGRPVLRACCGGNIFSVTGISPTRASGTLEQCAEAMGVDAGHMGYDTLAQSIPPAYMQLVYAQMCMRICERQFGVPAISFDERRERPAWAMRQLALWWRGAGEASHTAGLQPMRALSAEPEAVAGESPMDSGALPAGGERLATEREVVEVSNAAGERQAALPARAELRLAEVRELNYSHAGGYTRQWVSPQLQGRLEPLGCQTSWSEQPTFEQLSGENTFVEVRPSALSHALQLFADVLRAGAEGTRITAVVRPQEAAALRKLGVGFTLLPCVLSYGEGDALEASGLVAMAAGRRRWAAREFRLDHAVAREHMDPRDQGGYEYPAERKQAAAWREMPWIPEL